MPARGWSMLGEDWGYSGSEQGRHYRDQQGDPGPNLYGGRWVCGWVHAFLPEKGQLTEACECGMVVSGFVTGHIRGIVRGVAE